MIVYIAPVSGLLDKLQQQNGNQQRKSREEVVAPLPACSDFAMQNKSTWLGKFMKNHTRTTESKSSAGGALHASGIHQG